MDVDVNAAAAAAIHVHLSFCDIPHTKQEGPPQPAAMTIME